MTNFRQHPNFAFTTLATGGYTAGSGALSLVSAASFGAPTATNPIALIVASQGTAFTTAMNASNASIFLCTGITGTTATVAVAEGTTDRNYLAGDYVFCAPTGGDLSAIQAAVNALENAGTGGTPGGGSGQLQYNSAGAFGGAANLTVGSSGQLHFGAMAAPGTPANGDQWYDSGRSCFAFRSNGATGYHSRVIYLQTTNPAAITAAGATSVVGSGIGSVSLPAGFLNAVGRTLRIAVRGYGSTAAASPGNISAQILLGGSIVATSQTSNMNAGRSGTSWALDALLVTRAVGPSSVDTQGTLSSGQNGGAPMFVNSSSLSNGTVAGTTSPGTPTSIDLTAALTLDIQLNLGSTVAGNSFSATHIVIEALA